MNKNSGKTLAGCLRGVLLSQYPGNFGLVGRSTYPELRDTTRKTFFEVCPDEYYAESGGGQWKPSENYLRLINGSEIIFRHLDTISEKELLSLNLGWFFIDQAEEIGGRVFQILQSRLRHNKVPNRYGFIVCNPEPGNWIDKTFRTPILENRQDPDYHFMESSTRDNPYLPPDYIQTLLASYPEEMIKRYVEGRWDVFENQIYHEFDYRIHVVKPFEIPKNWERIVSVDHGMVNPTACLWAAIDFDSNVFIYDEYYSPGVVSQHAKEILRKTGDQRIDFWLIDPSTVNKTREKEGMPWSVLEEYEDYGLYFTPANNEMLAGINRVKEFLIPRMNRRNPITGQIPAPRLYIFRNCTNLIQEFPQYQWRKMRSLAQRNTLEQPRDYADHALDSCFIVNTSIKTQDGEIPIQEIKVGDKVLTRKGYKQVLSSGKTKEFAKVYRVEFSNGRSIVGTANHPVYIIGKGFVPIDELRYNNRVCTQISFLQQFKNLMGKGITNVVSTIKKMEKDFMLRFGNTILARSIEDFTSTIGIRIEKTMIYQTYSDLELLNTYPIMGKNIRRLLNIKEKSGNLQNNGMLQKMEENGIVNMEKSLGKIRNNIIRTVFFAGDYIKHFFQDFPNSVIQIVKRLIFGSNVLVKKVEFHSIQAVYNLTVEDVPEYFANGILVHNCRYILMSRFPAPLKRPTGGELILSTERASMNMMTQQLPKHYEGDDVLGTFEGPMADMNDLDDLTFGEVYE